MCAEVRLGISRVGAVGYEGGFVEGSWRGFKGQVNPSSKLQAGE